MCTLKFFPSFSPFPDAANGRLSIQVILDAVRVVSRNQAASKRVGACESKL
jgi:hypothetical protein